MQPVQISNRISWEAHNLYNQFVATAKAPVTVDVPWKKATVKLGRFGKCSGIVIEMTEKTFVLAVDGHPFQFWRVFKAAGLQVGMALRVEFITVEKYRVSLSARSVSFGLNGQLTEKIFKFNPITELRPLTETERKIVRGMFEANPNIRSLTARIFAGNVSQECMASIRNTINT